jgi:signal transduction histidine kinase/sugar lactone lactonase YvrE
MGETCGKQERREEPLDGTFDGFHSAPSFRALSALFDGRDYRISGRLRNCSRHFFLNRAGCAVLKTPDSSPRLTQAWWILLAVVTALPRLAAATPGEPAITTFSGAETGFHGASFGMAQDKDGLLYIATTGLVVFDGERWTKTAVPDTHVIRHLHFGNDGRLWAAGMGNLGWFTRGADRRWTFHSLLEKLPPEERSTGEMFFAVSHETGAIFASRSAVYWWNGENFRIWRGPGKDPTYPTLSRGTLYVYQPDSGLYRVDVDGPRRIGPIDVAGGATPFWIEPQKDGFLLMSNNGVFAYDGERSVPLAPHLVDFLQAGRLVSAVRLPDNRIAVATLYKGLAILRPDWSIEQILTIENGLPSIRLRLLFIGHDGDLWVSTGSHIVRVELSQRTTIYDQRGGLMPAFYFRFAKRGATLTVAGESGIYELSPDASRFAPIEALRLAPHSIEGNGSTLIVSGFRGANVWDGSAVTPLYSLRGDAFVSLPSRLRPGEIVLGLNKGIVTVKPDGTSRTLVEDTTESPTSLAEDHRGRLWYGTPARGLRVVSLDGNTPAQPELPGTSWGLPKMAGVTRVLAPGNGAILVFADNGAWAKAPDEERFHPVKDYPIRGLGAVSPPAADGRVWVALNNTPEAAASVGRISLQGGAWTWEAHAVDSLSEIGAPRALFVESGGSGHGVLWIGGTRSVLRHELGPVLERPPPRKPLVHAFAYKATGHDRQLVDRPLPYSTRMIELEFAAPEFGRRPQLRIQTLIEGLDNEWITLDASSRRELTAMRDGTYNVRARVVAETGVASEEAVLSFQVLPPWWRTAPAFLGLGLALAPIGYGIYRVRVRTLRRRNAELERKVRQRTEELEAANAAKTEFVANMSHDIRNPLNGIVGLTLGLEDSRLDPRQREMVATLRECTTYLSSLVDDVLDFATIEAGRVELRPGPFAARELLGSIVATLKTEASERAATLRLETDPALPPSLLGDAGRIQQILVNFVSNALKYAGGEIVLSAALPQNAPGEVEFSVTDRGPGIEPADQAKLFAKFSRVKQKFGREEIPGSGLGLASCRLLADIMGSPSPPRRWSRRRPFPTPPSFSSKTPITTRGRPRRSLPGSA